MRKNSAIIAVAAIPKYVMPEGLFTGMFLKNTKTKKMPTRAKMSPGPGKSILLSLTMD